MSLPTAFALVLLLLAPACRRGDEPAPRETEASLAALRAETLAAAGRGIEYLVARIPGLPPEWAISTTTLLYRIAPDEELALRLRTLLDAALERPVLAELPADLASPALLDEKRLRPVLGELWRRQLIGASWRTEAETLGAFLRGREHDLWASTGLAQQLVLLDWLHRIGIETQLRSDDVVAEIRWMWGVGDTSGLVRDPAFMYAATHVVYTRSGYFQRRPDPAQHRQEIEIFDRALESYARDFPENSNFVDIAGEVLASRKLLGLPETAAGRAVTRALLARQNPDGSWLVPRGFQAVHATASVVHGFVDPPAEFRRLEPPP